MTTGGNGGIPVTEGCPVQWRKEGVDQWDEPRLVLALNTDRTEAFCERMPHGIPVGELRVILLRKRKNPPATHS
jgi:hypothetical protein